MNCTAMALADTSGEALKSNFAQLVEEHLEYLALKHYSPATLGVRRIRLRFFVDWCAVRNITEPSSLTRKAIEEYQAHLFHYRKHNGEPLCSSTQHSRLTSLGVWLKWMSRRNLLEYNPVAELELPRASYKLPSVLTCRETEAVLHTAAASSHVKIRDRAILETFYSTGIRRTELLRLKLLDLDFDGGVLAIRGGKGNRDRVVPVGQRCVSWIERYLSQVRPVFVCNKDEQTVFVTSHGKPFTPNHLSSLVREYVKASGIGKRGACHLFRHTMATLMLEGGADIRYIQQMLGHAKLDTTQIYTHVSIPILKIVHAQTHPACRQRRGAFSVIRTRVMT